MIQAVTLALLLLVLLAIIGQWASGSRPEVISEAEEQDAVDDSSGDQVGGADDDGGEDAARAAMTADGWTFEEVADLVRLLPPAGAVDPLRPILSAPSALPDHFRVLLQVDDLAAIRRARERLPGELLRPGDLIAARVATSGHDPWRLEAVGRDGEYEVWSFDDEDEARVALAMIQDRVLGPGKAHGRSGAETERIFEKAVRRAMMTEAELARPERFEDDENEREP